MAEKSQLAVHEGQVPFNKFKLRPNTTTRNRFFLLIAFKGLEIK